MLPLRAFFRRPPRIPLRIQHSRARLRYQHDNHGPHKEYFQHPSQYPSTFRPELAPEIAPSTAQHIQPGVNHPSSQQQQHQQRSPSRLRRFAVTSFSLSLLFTLGIIAGTAVITWEYLQPPYERDTEEYAEIQEEIEDLLESSHICESLRFNNWKEEPIIRPLVPNVDAAGGEHHLIKDTLSGVQGITMKVFRSPAIHATMVVFFAGFGIEGWPDTVHGGAIASMLHEAHVLHMEPVMKQEGLTYAKDAGLMSSDNIAYIAPMRPGEVYSILVTNVGWGTGSAVDESALEPVAIDKLNNLYLSPESSAVMISGDNVPDFGILPDDEKPDQVGFFVDPKGGSLHATAKFAMLLQSDKVYRTDGEAMDDYNQRLIAEAKRILEATNKTEETDGLQTLENRSQLNDNSRNKDD